MMNFMKYITASLLTLFVLGLMIPSAFAEVPDWVKNNAGWWADGLIDDNSFVVGIQWLISDGIMDISATE